MFHLRKLASLTFFMLIIKFLHNKCFMKRGEHICVVYETITKIIWGYLQKYRYTSKQYNAIRKLICPIYIYIRLHTIRKGIYSSFLFSSYVYSDSKKNPKDCYNPRSFYSISIVSIVTKRLCATRITAFDSLISMATWIAVPRT
jgi:hypothetical protein